MIYTYEIEGIALQTGDIICTMNGKPDILPGEFWRLVGRLVPGDVDHVAVYLGPQGRCVEAGARGVIKFTVFDGVLEHRTDGASARTSIRYLLRCRFSAGWTRALRRRRV
ncbi:MAG: hypothetical protein QM730_15525 [Anaerolineales bacterium]